ncbi:hypothetical protein FHG87_009311 [Trinorchestia longiramus]|nr:hypothetical protein FHG87_009311 [Trinorchestia longiramus]
MTTDQQHQKSLQVNRQTYDVFRQMYTAELDQQLPAGVFCNISMQYQGFLNDKLVGFYRSKYITEDGKESWMATTQFSPTDARRAFPGFDEPGFKSTFDITLVHPSNYTAHSNMPPVSTKNSKQIHYIPLIGKIQVDTDMGMMWGSCAAHPMPREPLGLDMGPI